MSKVCSKCKIEQPLEKFSCNKRNEDGSCKRYNSWCTSCRTIGNRDRLGLKERPKAEITDNGKECLKCNTIKTLSEFSPSSRGKLQLSAYCKPCTIRATPEKARKYTADYRTRNGPRWRALHRLNMFKRKNLISVLSDGTVTDEILKALYEQVICCWCKDNVAPKQRTLEHIVELSQGGLHSIHNITMACFSCNSKRLNKNSQEKAVTSLFDKLNKEENDNFCKGD